MTSTQGYGRALARTALAGNPSDGYGGAVLAMTFANFFAQAEARPASRLGVEPAAPLATAAIMRFARELEPAALKTSLHWRTSIPRAVGLGGSSAIVIATLRALCELYRVQLDPADLAAMALAVERADLGIVGGLQDQVAQAYGGVTFMDFSEPPRCESLEVGLLPSLLIAYRMEAAQDSGYVHSSLRGRFERGEPAVLAAIEELTSLANRARDALRGGDCEELSRCVSQSFDQRARMLELDPRQVRLIERVRACGAGANYTGSGGAIVCVCRDAEHRTTVAEAIGSLGRVVPLRPSRRDASACASR